MKIRTDFVTNSSSYFSAEIIIDNPVLLEILQRYKDMGVFGDAELQFEIGSGGRDCSKTPAFVYYIEGPHDASPVSTLQKVLNNIIDVIDCCGAIPEEYDKDLYEQLKSELHQREEDINQGFVSVNWLLRESSNEWEYEGRLLIEDRFTYNNVNGEEYYYCEEDCDTSEIIRIEHRVNGVKLE